MTDISPNIISPSTRALAKAGGIMTLSIMIMSALIVLCTRLTEKRRVEILKENVQNIIGDEWQVAEEVKIHSPLETSAVSFLLRKEDKEGIAVVMRVETLYGPMPCVYLYNAEDGEDAEFAGVLCLSGTVSQLLKDGSSNIKYWARRIPSIVGDAVVGESIDMGVRDAR